MPLLKHLHPNSPTYYKQISCYKNLNLQNGKNQNGDNKQWKIEKQKLNF
jgi:hypothetical protein